jgi:hypothetical protein
MARLVKVEEVRDLVPPASSVFDSYISNSEHCQKLAQTGDKKYIAMVIELRKENDKGFSNLSNDQVANALKLLEQEVESKLSSLYPKLGRITITIEPGG